MNARLALHVRVDRCEARSDRIWARVSKRIGRRASRATRPLTQAAVALATVLAGLGGARWLGTGERALALLKAGERWSSVSQEPLPARPSDTGASASGLEILASPGASKDGGPATLEPRSARDASTPRTPTRAISDARRLFERASQLRLSGDLHGAARAYELMLRSYPRDARVGLAAFELGRLRMDRFHDPIGAARVLEPAAKLLTDIGLREDAMARRVKALDMASARELCAIAREEYLEIYPKGIHVRAVANACGVGR